MIRTQISFDEELYRRARVEAKRLGIFLAELCRRGLLRVLAEKPSDKDIEALPEMVVRIGNEVDAPRRRVSVKG